MAYGDFFREIKILADVMNREMRFIACWKDAIVKLSLFERCLV